MTDLSTKFFNRESGLILNSLSINGLGVSFSSKLNKTGNTKKDDSDHYYRDDHLDKGETIPAHQ
ncbi:hypothetical protein JCM19236_2011 [Vibrio sp. JCM 19236]|nr:hypothetical protein JCM19236_2011 [Vibrio sp. JCM 19236]